MMPVQTALMSEIPKALVSRASAMTNIISRVSGSFGIAILTVIMTQRLAYHSAINSWNLTYEKLFSAGSSLPLSNLMSMIGVRLFQTSYVQTINDIFIITSIITILAILPAAIIKKGVVADEN